MSPDLPVVSWRQNHSWLRNSGSQHILFPPSVFCLLEVCWNILSDEFCLLFSFFLWVFNTFHFLYFCFRWDFVGARKLFDQSVVFKQKIQVLFCFNLHFLKSGKQSLVKMWDRLCIKVVQFQVPFLYLEVSFWVRPLFPHW